MAYLNVLNDIKTCINLGVPGRVPIFGLGLQFNIRMAGLSHREYTDSIEKMVQCEIDAVEKYDYDWVIPFPDDFIAIEPLGVKTKDEENLPRAAYEYLPATSGALDMLKMPDANSDGRMPAYLEVLSRIKQELGDSICLSGQIAAPFTSVALVFGVENTLLLIYENPQLLKQAIQFFSDLQIEWGRAQIKSGTDALWVGDCVASSSFLSPVHYTEFAAEGALQVCTALKEDAFMIYHAGESSLEQLKCMAEINADALNVGEKIDIAKAKHTIGDKVALMGNLAPVEVLLEGTPEDVERETFRIMEAGKRGGGYIFNTGEGIPRQVPEQNIKTMIETAQKHRYY